MAQNFYRILAQSYTTKDRIAKVVRATSCSLALRCVAAELETAGYYPVDCKAV